jgi:UDP-N-acetylmuramyl pentapeptide phosphotransferase/UDP-N-acetylglucosamine-1-phosphate transferase
MLTVAAFLQHAVFGLALTALSAVLTWLLATRLRILDTPNERSSHSRPTPKSGGLAVVATFLAGMGALYALMDTVQIGEAYFLGFLCSGLVLVAVSLIDDVKALGFRSKLATQLACALVVLAFGIVVDRIQLPFVGVVELGALGYVVTLVWIIGLTNAFNFMDGLDGLAGGVAALVAALFGAMTLMEGSHFVYLASWVLIGSLAGFLAFNFPPARIFMGDVGSQFLGFAFAVLAVIAMRYDAGHTSFLVMPLLFFHFMWDTSFTMLRRWRAGENVAQAHRSHLYQLLNRLGFSHRSVSLYHYAVTLAQGAAAMAMLEVTGELRLLFFLPFLLWQTVFTVLVVRAARRAGLLPTGRALAPSPAGGRGLG